MERVYKLPLAMEPQPEGDYTVACPVLPELITEGDTIQAAIQNANDALGALIEAFQDLGRPLPSVLQSSAATTPLWIETAVTVA